MVSVEAIANRLVEYVARKASGLPVDDIDLHRITGSSRYPIMRKVVNIVASNIVVIQKGLIRCGICGKGPFTRRGFYLHLTRVHRNEIISMITENYEYLAKRYVPPKY